MKREIEIKCLLKDQLAKEALLNDLKDNYPKYKHLKSKVVISYFYHQLKDKSNIVKAAKSFLEPQQLRELSNLVNNSDNIVVKCRSINDKNFFAVKGAKLGEDAVHAVNRLELEVEISRPLEEINRCLIDSGINLASKWSSKRETYYIENDVMMDLEFVSGYGHKAELELVIEDEEDVHEAENRIRNLANKLGLKEADQALFGRMYEYYNQNWEEYFNSDKVFPENVWHQLGR